MDQRKIHEETSEQRGLRLARRMEQERERRARETSEQRELRLALDVGNSKKNVELQKRPSRGSRDWKGKEQLELRKGSRGWLGEV